MSRYEIHRGDYVDGKHVGAYRSRPLSRDEREEDIPVRVARTAHAGLFSVSRGAFPDLVVGDDPFG